MTSAEVRFKDLRADFGKTASDYGRHRAGFPDEFFDRLSAMGILKPGMRALDLGTGTGTIARGLALRGCDVVGLDRSTPLMEQAAELDRDVGVVVRYVNAPAEDTGQDAASFDLVTAGQCWHWFDRPRAAAEARRVLKSGGRLVIAHFDWIPLPGNMVEATEKLIEKHNPKWKLGVDLEYIRCGRATWELRDSRISRRSRSTSTRSIRTTRGAGGSEPAPEWGQVLRRMRSQSLTQSWPRCWRGAGRRIPCVCRIACSRRSASHLRSIGWRCLGWLDCIFLSYTIEIE